MRQKPKRQVVITVGCSLQADVLRIIKKLVQQINSKQLSNKLSIVTKVSYFFWKTPLEPDSTKLNASLQVLPSVSLLTSTGTLRKQYLVRFHLHRCSTESFRRTRPWFVTDRGCFGDSKLGELFSNEDWQWYSLHQAVLKNLVEWRKEGCSVYHISSFFHRLLLGTPSKSSNRIDSSQGEIVQ